MSLVALAKPTTNFCDPQFTAGSTISVAGTALSGNTGFTVPWVPGLVIVIVEGATPPGNVTLVNPAGSSGNLTVNVSGASNTLAFGPIWSQYANPSTGLVQVNVQTVTTAAAAAFILPPATSLSQHNPFQNNPTAADF